jgi:hypothetical protein
MQIMPSIEDVPYFFLKQANASYSILVPHNGALHPILPAPRLFKTAYASRHEIHASQPARINQTLSGPYFLLLLDVPHTFGPPFRAVRIFRPEINYQGVSDAVGYLATTSRAPYSWIEDYSRRQPGYFLTGLRNASDLWEIVACEPDPADRCTFVLSPLKLPTGLPRADFSKIQDAPLRAEAEQHWKNLEQAVIAHNSHGVVNAGASLSEALLRAFLKSPGSDTRSLSQMLVTLKDDLDAGSSAFSPLRSAADGDLSCHASIQPASWQGRQQRAFDEARTCNKPCRRDGGGFDFARFGAGVNRLTELLKRVA